MWAYIPMIGDDWWLSSKASLATHSRSPSSSSMPRLLAYLMDEAEIGICFRKDWDAVGQVPKKFFGRSGIAWDFQNSILVSVANLPCRLKPHSEPFYSAPINFWIRGNWPVCVSHGNTGHFHEQYYFLKKHWNNILTTLHRCVVFNALPYTGITAKTAPKTPPKTTAWTAPRHPTPHPALHPKQHLEQQPATQHRYSNHNHIRTQSSTLSPTPMRSKFLSHKK